MLFSVTLSDNGGNITSTIFCVQFGWNVLNQVSLNDRKRNTEYPATAQHKVQCKTVCEHVIKDL